MAKLKTFVTSVGFFELAVAAPSMKAASEILGIDQKSFHKGFAKQTDDRAIVAATIADPLTVLRRPVGMKGNFARHAELPKIFPDARPAPKQSKEPTRNQKYDKKNAANEVANERAERTEQKRIHAARARAEKAAKVAHDALDHADARHQKIIEKLDAEQGKLTNRRNKEDERWENEQRRLEEKLRHAKD
jgi:colicin import membrane protein